MKKLNNSGFALVETLVVSVFVVSIFTLIFTNFYPLIGEYEKRENYDTVDGKYSAFWIRTLIEDNIENNQTFKQTVKNAANGGNYFYDFSCDNASFNTETKALCNNLVSDLNIKKIYITQYNLTRLKSTSLGSFSRGTQDYVNYLPTYVNSSSRGANYRVILEINHTKDENNYNVYSNMEVVIK